MTDGPTPPGLRPEAGDHAATRDDLGRLLRWAWYSLALNLSLSLLHGTVAYASGSLAVTAELLHNFVDMASAAAVIVGLKLAARKSRTFPFGLYKVENMVAAGVAVLIFFTAYEVAATAVLGAAPPPKSDIWMVVALVLTTAAPLIFSHFEMRVAVDAGSPALIANAREYRVHAYTTGLALTALLSAGYDLPLDRIAALLITVAVAKTGWGLLVDALRVLLDASVSREDLAEISRSVASDPAVADVNWVTARNAGRVRFVEAGVSLRPNTPAPATVAIARIERKVRETMPQIERVLLHVEAATSERERVAVPVADLSGAISAHFGEAPFFAFVTLDRRSHGVEDQRICANPHLAESRAKGLRVAEWLVGQKVDRVLVPRDFEGRGPTYVFREAGIEVEITSEPTLARLFGTGTGARGV